MRFCGEKGGLGSVVLVIVSLSLFCVVAAAEGPPVPCSDVIALSNQLTRKSPSKSRDPVYIGRRLHIEAYWAEKCLQAYGRRVSRSARPSDEKMDQMEEIWESGELVKEKVGERELRKRRARREGKDGWGSLEDIDDQYPQ